MVRAGDKVSKHYFNNLIILLSCFHAKAEAERRQ